MKDFGHWHGKAGTSGGKRGTTGGNGAKQGKRGETGQNGGKWGKTGKLSEFAFHLMVGKKVMVASLFMELWELNQHLSPVSPRFPSDLASHISLAWTLLTPEFRECMHSHVPDQYTRGQSGRGWLQQHPPSPFQTQRNESAGAQAAGASLSFTLWMGGGGGKCARAIAQASSGGATPAQPASGGGCLPQPRWAVCATGVGAHQGQTSREGEKDIWWTARTARGGTGHLGLTETQRGRLWTACGQRCVDSKNSQTTPATTSTSSIRQLLGAADAQTAHHATFSTAPTHQLLGSANAETTPARAPAAAADRKQRPDATCEGKNG